MLQPAKWSFLWSQLVEDHCICIRDWKKQSQIFLTVSKYIKNSFYYHHQNTLEPSQPSQYSKYLRSLKTSLQSARSNLKNTLFLCISSVGRYSYFLVSCFNMHFTAFQNCVLNSNKTLLFQSILMALKNERHQCCPKEVVSFRA